MNGGLPITTTLVGVLTGKITLATAAQAAWNKVALINPYILVGAAIAAVIVGIGVLIATQEEEIASYQEVVDAVHKETDALDKLKESRDEAISANLAEIDNAEALIYQYKQLADETGVVREGTDEYARAKSLANQINAVAPGAIEDLEDENGAYLKICDSIDLLIAKKRAEAIADANQESYETAIQNRQQYVEKLNELDEQRKAALQELQDAQDAYAQWDSDYNKNRITEAQDAVNEINAAYDEQVQIVADAVQTITSQEELWVAMESDNIEEIKAAISGYGDKIVEFTGQNADACMESAKYWEDYYNKLKELQDQGEINDEAWIESVRQTYDEQVQIAAEGISAMIQAVSDKTADAKEAQQGINDAILETVGELKEPLSTEAAQAVAASVMQMQVEANGATAVGENFAQGYYEGLFSNLGIADDVAAQIVKDAIEAAKAAQDSNSPSRVMYDAGGDFVNGYVNGITDNQNAAESPASELAQAAINAVRTGLTGIPIIGGLFASMFGQGVTSNKGAATSAASGIASASASAASSQKAQFSKSGNLLATSFASGIKAQKGATDSTARAIAQSSANTIDAQKSAFNKAGSTVAGQFKTGINSAKSAIQSTSKAIAAAGHVAASQTRSSWNSVGSNLAAGLAAGIRNGASAVISAASSIASKAIAAAKNALGIHSPSKVAEKELGLRYDEGIARGEEKNAKLVADASSNVATKAIDAAQKTLDKTLSNPKTLTLDTIISQDTSGIGDRLIAAVNARISRVSTAFSENPRSNPFNFDDGDRKIINIDYHPEQKCDEPISARRLYAINNENARQLRRSLARV